MQVLEGDDPTQGKEPFLQPAELPGSYHGAQLPSPERDLLNTDQSAPPLQKAELKDDLGHIRPDRENGDQLAEQLQQDARPSRPSKQDGQNAAEASERNNPTGGRTEAATDTLRELMPGPAAAAEKEDGSGTDTDEDGELIAKARQKAALERQRATAAIRRAGMGTGAAIQDALAGPALVCACVDTLHNCVCRGTEWVTGASSNQGSVVCTTGRPRAGGGITLKLLIDEGILAPGDNVLTVEYKNSMTYASLGADGRIFCVVGYTDCAHHWELSFSLGVCPEIGMRPKQHARPLVPVTRAQVHGQEMVFESPSAFSIFLKRLVNPSRKADDGWKTVKYNGKFLEAYKLELARRRFGTREENSCDALATRQLPRQRIPTLKSLESGGCGARPPC
jgi:hypothetical protein